MRSHTRDVACAAAFMLAASCSGSDVIGPGSRPPSASAALNFLNGSPVAFQNSPPGTRIIDPAGDTSFVVGADIAFAGSSYDPEDGWLAGASLTWVSSVEGVIGTGTAITTVALSVGTHRIALVGSDSRGAVSMDSVMVTITAPVPNRPPTASIVSPASGAAFTTGASVSFAGSANDPEQGLLSGASLVWTSNRHGVIGTGTAFSVSTLSVGSHLITLSATDADGAVGTQAITLHITAVVVNGAPATVITAPSNGSTFIEGQSVTLSGSSTDPEDGALTGASLQWSSSIDGVIGTGVTVSADKLSVGVHTILLSATDAQGAKSSQSVTVMVTARDNGPLPNLPPTASISSPAQNATFNREAAVVFAGTGSDPESGVLTGGSLTWTSSRDGVIGTGATFSRGNLTAGVHTITLTARDPQNATAVATRTITVAAPVQVPAPSGAEPAGMTMIDDRPFNCWNPHVCESNWIFSAGRPNSMVIVADPTAPYSGPNVAQMNFMPGLSSGTGPASAELGIPAARRPTTMYVSMWLKLSSNFQSHPTSVNKLVHFFINGSNRVYTMARGDGSPNGPLTPAFGLQGIAEAYFDGRSKTSQTVDLLPNLGTAQFIRDQWHHQEMVLTANTAGVADGSVEMWLDGTKILSYNGIMFTADAGYSKWQVLKWNPTWGGLGGTVSASFYMQVDNIYISGK